MSKKIIITSLFSAFLLSACAHQVPRELEVAEKTLASAWRAGAQHTAADTYISARNQFEQGKQLVQKGDEEKGRHLLLDAILTGHEAELQACRQQLEQTENQLNSAEDYIIRLEKQRNSYFEALSSIYDDQKLSQIKKPDTEKSYNLSANYRVRSGENLFAIAARKTIYGDALLWPLIYKANRDQIKDPQQIYPGQVLSIPRDVSDQEKEEARATARESKIFQPSTEKK
ncbi:MAG: hypothetical protein C0615_05010 [Desulfuromonas sp.]|nr:MAG: hypothetical protein C0615_05010 [Desulfuromonas sp.]